MTRIIHGGDGRWAVVSDTGSVWFSSEEAARVYAKIMGLTPEQAAQVTDSLDGLNP